MFNRYNKYKSHPQSYYKKSIKEPHWYFYWDTSDQKDFGRYKLHISFDPYLDAQLLKKIQDDLHNLLHQALDQYFDIRYKVLDIAYVLANNQTPSKKMLRQMCNSFVIYLRNIGNDLYFHKIAELIFEIEKMLNNVRIVEQKAECDLSLDSHVIFRQAYLDSDTNQKNYIKAITKDPNDVEGLAKIKQLEIEGKNSDYYKKISSELAKIKFKEQTGILRREFDTNITEPLIKNLKKYRKLLKNKLVHQSSEKPEQEKIIQEKRVEIYQKIEEFKKIRANVLYEREYKDYEEMESQLKETAEVFEEQAWSCTLFSVDKLFSGDNASMFFYHADKKPILVSDVLGLNPQTADDLREISDELCRKIVRVR